MRGMMKCMHCFWVTSVLSALPLSAQEYIDDRSSPEAVITSLYNAINAEDFARAWSYFDQDTAPSYSAYIRGYDETEWVEVRTGTAEPIAADSGQAWQVPVVLEATEEGGAVRFFEGCYYLTQEEPRNRPPYAPIAIQSGHFHVVDAPGETVQGSCNWPDSQSISR